MSRYHKEKEMPTSNEDNKSVNAKPLPTPDEKGIYTLNEAPAKSFLRHVSPREQTRGEQPMGEGSRHRTTRD